MPKLLIADSFNQAVKETLLKEWGHKYDVHHDISLAGDSLAKELVKGGYDALIVGMKDVPESTLKAWRNSKPDSNLCVIRAGSEPSHIAYATAAELGIAVMNTPGASKEPVVKYIEKRLPENGKGQILALIGYGEIGKDVAKEAIRRNFKVQVYSPHLTPEKAEADGVYCAATVADALKKANSVVLSTHLINIKEASKINRLTGRALLTPSAGIIDAQALHGLSKGAHIINISRPWICNITDIGEAIKSGTISRINFNTGSHDLERLRTEYKDLSASRGVSLDLASSFMTKEASQNVAKEAIRRLIGFHEHNEVITPIFNLDIWNEKSRLDLYAESRISQYTKESSESRPMAKKKMIFIGAGIESLVSVMEFARQTQADGTRDKYELLVVEKEPEAACGTTFCNGGNFTNIEGLTGLKLGSTSLTKLHKSITKDPSSDGWLTVPHDEMTEEQHNWVVLADKLASKPYADIYHGAAQTITNLGKFSVDEAKKFFNEFPHLRQAAHFQYLDGENTWLVRIHDKPERAKANFDYFKQLGTEVKLLSYDEMLTHQPGLAKAAIKDKIIAAGGVGMKGGCINAREFTRALAKTLQRDHDVIFHYNTQANEILVDADGHAVGIDTSKGFIRGDELVVSTGVNTSIFQGAGIDVPVQPVGGCTLTVPIPRWASHYPKVPFKVISDDGVIVFSPHLPEGETRPTELRAGGMYWYDPHHNKELSSPQAQYGLGRVKEYLRQVFPDVYRAAQRQNTFNEWVGFRPYTPDNIPIIDKVTHVDGREVAKSGIWVNMGHGPGGTSYSFASAKLLVSMILGKELKIDGVKNEDFSLARFDRYRALDRQVSSSKAALNSAPERQPSFPSNSLTHARAYSTFIDRYNDRKLTTEASSHMRAGAGVHSIHSHIGFRPKPILPTPTTSLISGQSWQRAIQTSLNAAKKIFR